MSVCSGETGQKRTQVFSTAISRWTLCMAGVWGGWALRGQVSSVIENVIPQKPQFSHKLLEHRNGMGWATFPRLRGSSSNFLFPTPRLIPYPFFLGVPSFVVVGSSAQKRVIKKEVWCEPTSRKHKIGTGPYSDPQQKKEGKPAYITRNPYSNFWESTVVPISSHSTLLYCINHVRLYDIALHYTLYHIVLIIPDCSTLYYTGTAGCKPVWGCSADCGTNYADGGSQLGVARALSG